jgi:hypothetical protein
MSTLKPEHFAGLVSAFTLALKEHAITLEQARGFVDQLTNVVLEETVATRKSGNNAPRPPAMVHEMPSVLQEDKVAEARARAAQKRKAS